MIIIKDEKDKGIQASMDISFKVTPSQKETIESRMSENGFDEISAYIKVVALKMQRLNLAPASPSTEEESIELGFQVTESQKTIIEEKVKESGCGDLRAYLQYVSLHGVVSAVAEVRSSGNLNDMLERIAKMKAKG